MYGIANRVINKSAAAMFAMRKLIVDLIYGLLTTIWMISPFPDSARRKIMEYAAIMPIWVDISIAFDSGVDTLNSKFVDSADKICRVVLLLSNV